MNPLSSLTSKQWEKITVKHHHGINLPLSALHSAQSCGIGEFFDLIPIIDWCKQIGFDVIQLLPLNTTDNDPSPYNPNSSCALSFIYLSLYALPNIENLPELKEKLTDFHKFNLSPQVPYTDILAHKLLWLRAYFDAMGTDITKSSTFLQFYEENPWVQSYALFKTLKDQLGNTPCATWPQELQFPSEEKRQELFTKYRLEILFYSLLQFLCYEQLKKVKTHADECRILLMGDIPILISKESVDVWQYPEYFDLNFAAGAPPDLFNPEGQYWGFPLFRWDSLRKNQFDWWIKRLKYAENFFSIFRIDHVLGFFRIWAIPLNHPAKEGYFIPAAESQASLQGQEILKMLIANTTMLPIAEDLGVVANFIRPCLEELGICGTKVMRWERKWKEGGSFIPFQEYTPISLTTVSTHDSETLTLWWQECSEEAKLFAETKNWMYSPTLSQEQRLEILWDSHHTPSLFHINLLQEYLSLFSDLSWDNPAEERINTPGKILSTNWTFRFRPSVETLISHKGLSSTLQNLAFSKTPPLNIL